MKYKDYFTRVQDYEYFDPISYSMPINPPLRKNKIDRLIKDCFGCHLDMIYSNVENLSFDKSSSEFYINPAYLSSYFVGEIYKPPDLYIDKLRLDGEAAGEKIDYEEFINDFAKNSFSEIKESGFSLGENRVTCVLGDVGIGKSAFMRKVKLDLDRKRKEIDPNYEIFSVYIDIEDRYHYADEVKPLKKSFLKLLFDRIQLVVAENKPDSYREILDETRFFDERANEVLALQYLIAKLKKNGIRIIIYIDNLDSYQYYYARYSFFDEYYRRQESSVIDNILWLKKILTSKSALGHLGLSVMLSARTYVYYEMFARFEGVSIDNHIIKEISISKVTPEVVIESRFALLREAIKVINRELPGAAKIIHEKMQELEDVLVGIDSPGPKNSFQTICKLGQHGHRSLVNFLFSLNISYDNPYIIQRIFKYQLSIIYNLYFNNMMIRYSQARNHFPNIFLVDCTVMDPKEFVKAHRPHKHSYWLKYLMLGMIVQSGRFGIRVGEILEAFRDIGGYDDFLVRHIIGSLCTANEFRCAETNLHDASSKIESKRLYATERGVQLFSKRSGVEFCFDFQYLSSIIDDKWIAYPTFVFEEIYRVDTDFGHLYFEQDEYNRISAKSIFSRAVSILHFVRVLENSFDAEIIEGKPRLFSIVREKDLVPSFSLIYDYIIQTSKKLLSSNIHIEDLSDLIFYIKNVGTDTSKNKEYRDFFKKYYNDLGCLVSK